MTLITTIKKIEKDKLFKAWHKENSDFYMAHAFTMTSENEKKHNWDIGFYSPKKDKLVVVTTVPEIKIGVEEDVFKKEGKVNELVIKDVKIDFQTAMDKCEKLLTENYSAHGSSKKIIMLQKLDVIQYNITIATKSFSIINIRINAITGDVISQNLQSLMNLGKWEKGERER